MFRSRVVAFLRILLPLAALAVLSTLFLFSERRDVGSLLPYADVTPENINQRPAVTAPTYAGVATDGTRIEMTAATATPGATAESLTTASKVDLTLKDLTGGIAHLVAGAGEMEGETIRLSDHAKLTTSTGWELTSDKFVAETQQGSLVSDVPVEAVAPFGTLTANSMELRTLPDGSGQHVLDLKGDVRMIYQP
ncbi:LPS ABC transporter substrate-binding protein LptC [Paracoccus aminophilus]|uniref:Lipopolysaccharide export system protein LptC n=1 Tax=Paracoccus aminophilus JCM 7686 TaxID=1367847 RepID=S5XXP6_PARAH|nr:LPS ABC transporter substrate-binding protein LptC [Paracoccus aminophilus]AGT10047.1 lipopolysaccharide export system protein LptC [Paracoccus aminophilus JCM 7686]